MARRHDLVSPGGITMNVGRIGTWLVLGAGNIACAGDADELGENAATTADDAPTPDATSTTAESSPGEIPDYDCDGITAFGNEVGDFVHDFASIDQFGQTTALHAACNDVVYLISGAVW